MSAIRTLSQWRAEHIPWLWVANGWFVVSVIWLIMDESRGVNNKVVSI